MAWLTMDYSAALLEINKECTENSIGLLVQILPEISIKHVAILVVISI